MSTQTNTRTSASSCCSPSSVPVESLEVMSRESHEIKEVVREYYGTRARTGTSCCGSGGGCAGGEDFDRISAAIGYSEEELRAVPEGANLGLGCGNPTAIDTIPEGATVLDLGSGAGFDCFLAARKVGPFGRVIGVDMTPEMLDRARANAAKAGYENVEFRMGEIEALPVADASVDVIISNCVINLSPEKPRVFAEAFRVLKPGGRLMVSDIVLTRPLPGFLKPYAELYANCLTGAELKDRYLEMIREAGFEDLEVSGEDDYLAAVEEEESYDWLPEEIRVQAREMLADGLPVLSLKIAARRP